jgi:DNA polymerase III epsilon subunit family exonuclease
MANYKFVVVDVETGGLDPEKHSILSIGAVILENGVIIDEHEVLLKEVGLLSTTPEALKVNGLTEAVILRDGMDIRDAMTYFTRFLTNNNIFSRATLAGHNVGFDIGFLKRWYRLTGRERDFGKQFSYRSVDTIAAAHLLQIADRLPSTLSLSLNSLCEHFGITIRSETRHNALEDSRATAKLFVALSDMLRKVPEF